MENPSEKIIVAFDFSSLDECKKLLDDLGSDLKFVKLGSVLFSKYGPSVLSYFSAQGVKIFLDLKFHDIPNTISKAVEFACSHVPISLLTIHASGGPEMIYAARTSIERMPAQTRPSLLAVTILTSLSRSSFSQVGFTDEDVSSHVCQLGVLAMRSGAHGLVCSPQEVSLLKNAVPKDALLVVPGIRSSSSPTDDQQRTSTASNAFKSGASHVVIGRPIYDASDPRKAFQGFVSECLHG